MKIKKIVKQSGRRTIGILKMLPAVITLSIPVGLGIGGYAFGVYSNETNHQRGLEYFLSTSGAIAGIVLSGCIFCACEAFDSLLGEGIFEFSHGKTQKQFKLEHDKNRNALLNKNITTKEVIKYITSTGDYSILNDLEEIQGTRLITNYSQLKEAYDVLNDCHNKQEMKDVQCVIKSLDTNKLYFKASNIAEYKTEIEQKDLTAEQIITEYALLENQ